MTTHGKDGDTMQIAIISTALSILLFLCFYFGYKLHKADITRLNYEIERLREKGEQNIEQYQKNGVAYQKRLDELQQKLFDYMDLTRKEALDSYRRGLQDGIATASQRPVYAPQNPIKTMEEHEIEREEFEAVEIENKAYDKELAAMLAFTGDLPKGGQYAGS